MDIHEQRSAWESYFNAGTSTLRNKLGITGEALLRETEYEITAQRTQTAPPVEATFDSFKATHHHIFEPIYEWAGQLRTVNLAKAGTQFAPVQDLNTRGNEIFERLAAEPPPTTTHEISDQLSRLVGELNQLHPFREGTGRTLRTYATNWAQQHGHDIDLNTWPEHEWRTASIAAFHQDHQPLADLVTSHLQRLPLDNLRDTITDWANTYDQLTRIDHLDNGVTFVQNSALLADAIDHNIDTIRTELQTRFGTILDTLEHDANARGLGHQHLTETDAHTIGRNVAEPHRIAVTGAIAQFRDAWNIEDRNTKPAPTEPLQVRHFEHVKTTIRDAMTASLTTNRHQQPTDPGPQLTQ